MLTVGIAVIRHDGVVKKHVILPHVTKVLRNVRIESVHPGVRKRRVCFPLETKIKISKNVELLKVTIYNSFRC